MSKLEKIGTLYRKIILLFLFRGVVSVGVVSSQMALGDDVSSYPKFFKYEKPENQTHSLDLNHDYFIIVEESDTEFDVRANLMREVAKKLAGKTDNSEKVTKAKAPMVCLLIEGGTRAIKAFSNSLLAKIPCVIISGTGRAADFLAKTKTLYDRDPNLQPEKMINLLSDFLETKVQEKKVEEMAAEEKKKEEEKKEEEIKEITETYWQLADALDCLKKNYEKLDDYMRVCQIDSVELDKNILELLYLQEKNKIPYKVEQALDLSLSWDRAEVFGKIIRQNR